jgi:hypothetical protein
MVFYSLPVGIMLEAPNGGFVVIAKLKDAPLFEKTMAALGNFAAAQSDGALQVRSNVQEDGRTLHSWVIAPLAMMQILPSWAVVGDYAVIGSNPPLYHIAVKQIASAGPGADSIRTTEGYKKATAKLPDSLMFLGYTDSKTQLNQILMQVQQLWPMVTMFATQQGLNLPFMLPSVAHIIKDAEPSCTYCRFDAEGLRSCYSGPGVEPSLGVVAGAAMGAGILMPALARTRQMAQRMMSGTNLTSIGKALLIYASENEGNYPQNLQVLVDKAGLSPKSLESPHKPEWFDGPSYIYIAGQSATMNPQNIIAYDNPEFCPDGVNVLFNDTHVQHMEPDEFLRELRATYERLGREMPEIKFKSSTRITPVEK